MLFTIENLCNGLIPTKKQEDNLIKLCFALNTFFNVLNEDFRIIAGLLTKEGAIGKGEKENSPLTTGEAVILEDKNFKLTKYICNNIELLERNGLFVKNPAMTVSKTLTQTVGEKSYMCNQVFLQIKPADSVIFNENEEE